MFKTLRAIWRRYFGKHEQMLCAHWTCDRSATQELTFLYLVSDFGGLAQDYEGPVVRVCDDENHIAKISARYPNVTRIEQRPTAQE